MFNKVVLQIKTFAMFFLGLGIIASLVASGIMVYQGVQYLYYVDDLMRFIYTMSFFWFTWALGVIVLGPLAAWIVSVFIYGAGLLLENKFLDPVTVQAVKDSQRGLASKIHSLCDKVYGNIGLKMKITTKIFSWVGVIGAVLACVIMCLLSWSYIWWAIGTLVIVLIATWIFYLILSAWGLVLESSNNKALGKSANAEIETMGRE